MNIVCFAGCFMFTSTFTCLWFSSFNLTVVQTIENIEILFVLHVSTLCFREVTVLYNRLNGETDVGSMGGEFSRMMPFMEA